VTTAERLVVHRRGDATLLQSLTTDEEE